VDRNRNNAVAAEAALAESDRLQKEQVRLYQAGRHDEAQRNMAGIAKDLEEKNLTLKDDRVKRKIEALNVENRQMGTATASPSAQQDYLKSSKQRLYQAKAGKRSGFSLQPGDKGLEVEQLQEALKKAGVYKGPIDGIYDEDVKIAVRAYQQAKNLSADGVAGATTMDAMGLY
jgi:murein L,D-transpeptidase YcbB/YkuD